MLQLFRRSAALGIEITPAAVRVASLSGSGMNGNVLSVAKADLPAGIVSGTYSSLNIAERDGLVQAIKSCLGSGAPAGQPHRAALCLPDGIFRVQTLEFDDLPSKKEERERLIRWRVEKTASFDLSDTILRYQVLLRQGAGFTILICIAKRSVIAQYEAVLEESGIEPWSVGLSSFSTLNFYAPYMTKKTPAYALTYITEDSFATIVSENNGARFYRFKEIKRGSADELYSRLVREIDDSLHFYSHMDQSGADVVHLYLTGEPSTCDAVAAKLSTEESLHVEVLSPEVVLPSAAGSRPEMAAALGAGKTL
jgi:Tfp pilus assembly PilM family ATPase